MVKIVFRNTEQRPRVANSATALKVFRAQSVHIVGHSLVATIGEKEVLLARKRGMNWQVGYRFYSSVEIQSIALKLVEVEEPDTQGKVA